MAHDPNANDEFELAFPLWSLQVPSMLGKGDDRQSFITLTRAASGEVFWPVFTNLLLAEQFLTITEMKDHRPFKMRDFDDLYEVANYWTGRGIKYIGLNVSLFQREDGQYQDITTLVEIKDFLADVREWEQESKSSAEPEQP